MWGVTYGSAGGNKHHLVLFMGVDGQQVKAAGAKTTSVGKWSMAGINPCLEVCDFSLIY